MNRRCLSALLAIVCFSFLSGCGSALSYGVAALAVEPSVPVLLVGQTAQLHATANYANGTSADVTASTTWSAAVATLASVNAHGQVTCNAVGTSKVAASNGNVSSNVAVTCAASKLSITNVPSFQFVGQLGQLRATATYANGTSADVTTSATWSSASASIVSVNSNGMVTCKGAGSTQISAASGGASATVAVSCSVPTVAISGIPSLDLVGQAAQLHAKATYANGTSVDVTLLSTWTSASPGIATISWTGQVSCKAAGKTQITATSGGGSTSAALFCSVPTLSISGVPSAELAGQSTPLHATVSYTNGTTTDVTGSATWTTASASIASVNAQGVLTCAAAGSTHISASASGLSSSATVVCALPTLSLSGTPSSLAVSQSAQLHAALTNPDGTVTDATSSAAWSTGSSATATVNAHGQLTCNAAGLTPVTAALHVTGASAPVTASAGVSCTQQISSLAVSPASITTRVGTPVQISVTGSSAGGAQVALTSGLLWTSSSAVASVSPSGLVSCASAGTSSISAALSSTAASATVTCTAPSMNTPSYFAEQSDDFAGPFPSWTNVKTAFGAKGDGSTDDTAAIQRALDAFNQPGASSVLWFPAGTYVVKQTLAITHKQNFSVLGEDPATTTLSWHGANGGTMLQADAATWFRISRLTFQGNGVANTAETITTLPNSTVPGGNYSTFNELSDQHITGVALGINLAVDAETAIQRVWFDGLSSAGVSLGNFNTLNIFVTDSLFTDCDTGVTNKFGAGNFIVENNFFARSHSADMSLGNTGYFTARHNTSVSSRQFFVAFNGGANTAMTTLQNNTVLDPQTSAFGLGNPGPWMFLDNVVRQRDPSVSVVNATWDLSALKTVFSFSNTYSTNPGPLTENRTAFQGKYISQDDSTVDASQIPDVAIPANVYTPANLHHPIFEVTSFSDAGIQSAINAALSSGQSSPVVHLPAGSYILGHTVTVPAGSTLQLIGDDVAGTHLIWTGGAGAGLEIATANVSVKYLSLDMTRHGGDGILLPLADQPNTQLVVDQAQLQGGNASSVNFDGVEHLSSELFNTYTGGSETGVRVGAGPFRAAKEATLGITNFYTGSLQSEGNGTSFDVSAGGKFMVQDNWHDGGLTSPNNFRLSGSGTVTEQTGMVAMSSTPFVINNFDGNISLIGLQFGGGFDITSGANHTNLLDLGLVSNQTTYLPSPVGNVVINNIANAYYAGGAGQVQHDDTPDAQWLRTMLAQTRSEYAAPLRAMNSGSSRIRLSRVGVWNAASAIHVTAGQRPAQLFYVLSSGSSALSSASAGCLSTPLTGTPSGPTQWLLTAGGDGDFEIVAAASGQALQAATDATGTAALSLGAVTGSYMQRWTIQTGGDGSFVILNRATGQMLSSGSNNGGCTTLTSAGGSSDTSWTINAH